MQAISLVSGTSTKDSPGSHAKLAKACQDFEAFMLNSLLGPLQETMGSVPGCKQDEKSAQYRSLATQVMAEHLARTGGTGLGQMVMHNLLKIR